MRYLESERLLIKPVEEEDIYGLMEMRWIMDIMKYLIHEPLSKQSQLEWFKSLRKDKDLALSIFLKMKDQSNKSIGTIGLYDIDRRHQRAVWRVRLLPEVQGQGIGYESVRMVLDYGFSVLNLKKICSDSFAENEGIVKLSQKLGFVKEGLLRKHYYNEGGFRDAIVFGLLKEEFYSQIEKNDGH